MFVAFSPVFLKSGARKPIRKEDILAPILGCLKGDDVLAQIHLAHFDATKNISKNTVFFAFFFSRDKVND